MLEKKSMSSKIHPGGGALLLASLSFLCASAAPVLTTWADESHAEKRLPPLEVSLDLDEVDLERGELTVRMSRPAAMVKVKVLGVSGAVIDEVERRFAGAPARAPLKVQWSPGSEPVARIEVFGHDEHGYYKGVAITPWSFDIPHEDVIFETDSAEIRPGQAGKLEASLALINKELTRAKHLGKVTLFILAHTDTVGSAEYNLRLSTRRAQAIARWFRQRGLRIAMAYDGVGENALKVKTADEVEEPKNRRVDYMLSVEPPRFKKSGAAPSWKAI
jgi:outer membrane protein OmpA-like peptidoglycan-associated protein